MAAEDKKPTVKYDHNSGNIDNNITESYVAGYTGTAKYGIDRKFVVLIIFAVLLLLIGIVLIVLANVNSCKVDKDSSSSAAERIAKDTCSASDEASRVGLNEFLVKVKDVYHEVFPEEIAWQPEVTDQEIRNKFKVHDPKPGNLKKIWNKANDLLKESKELVCSAQHE